MTDTTTEEDVVKPDRLTIRTSQGLRSHIASRAGLPALVVVVLVGLSAWFCISHYNAWNAERDVGRQRDAVEQLAVRAVTDLSTMDSNTITERMGDLMSISSGNFRSQLSSSRTNQIKAVRASNVVSTGVVNAMGVADLNSEEATVALAVTAKVSDAKHKTPQSNLYRITVHLQHAGSGTWVIDSLEFVQ